MRDRKKYIEKVYNSITWYMKEYEITRNDLAKYLKISPQAVGQMLKHKHDIRVSKYLAIAEYFQKTKRSRERENE